MTNLASSDDTETRNTYFEKIDTKLVSYRLKHKTGAEKGLVF